MAKKLQTDIFSKAVKVTWEQVTHLPVGRSAHTAVLLHGSVYVGGGFEGKTNATRKDCYRLDIYNVYTKRWDPSPITTPQCVFAMTVLDEKLIIAGGWTNSGKITNKVFVLNRGQWINYSELPTARAHTTAVACNSTMIVVGGEGLINGSCTVLPTTELLDTTNGCWYTCDDLPVPHLQLKGKIINSALYLLGGIQDGKPYPQAKPFPQVKPSPQVFIASLDNLSSHQLKWKSLPDSPWCCLTPAVLYNNFLLTVGGRQPSNVARKTNEVCAFNPSTGLWTQIANIPKAVTFPGMADVADDILIMMGGANIQGEYLRDTYIGQFF